MALSELYPYTIYIYILRESVCPSEKKFPRVDTVSEVDEACGVAKSRGYEMPKLVKLMRLANLMVKEKAGEIFQYGLEVNHAG
jgi:hypothetical protein